MPLSRSYFNTLVDDTGSGNGTPVDKAMIDAIYDDIDAALVVNMSAETSTVYNGAVALTPKFAKIAASSSGNNALVAAVASKKIRVLEYTLIANGTVNAKFQSDGAGTPVDLTGLKYCVANMGLSAPFSPVGWFESASGKSLDLNLSAAIAVGGELVYVEV
jgi:hypothetical protein